MATPKPNDPKVAIGYIRLSKEKEDKQEQLGPAAQRAALERYCKAHRLRLVSVFEDLGKSGAAPIHRRRGFMAALAALRQHGAGVLLVHKRDRLARAVAVAVAATKLVEREGAEVHSAEGGSNDATPEGDFNRQILDAAAQYERASISRRTAQ